jgi:O-antigen ligase
MLDLTKYKSLITIQYAIRLADVFLVYTILAPIILNVFGSYFKLNENFIRTFLLILGPALISCVIYIRAFGLPSIKKYSHILFFVSGLTLTIFLSSLKNWDSIYTKESLKFFIAYCAFGFVLGLAAKLTLKRAKNSFIIWIYFILIVFLFYLFLFPNHDYLRARFTLPGDNAARTAALFFFFSFCGLTNFLLSRTIAFKAICGFIFFICVFIGLTSNTRSAILIFGMTLFSYLLFQIFQSKSKSERFSLVSTISVFVVFCCLIWFLVISSSIKNRIFNILNYPGQTLSYILNNDQESYKKIVRLPIWNSAYSKFKVNPLFGIGYGSEYYNEIIKKKFSHPHSIIFQLLAETGLIGFGIFLLFTIFVLKKAITDYKSLQNTEDKLTYLFYPLSFTFFLLFACFHFAIHENYFFWYFAGMITGFDFQKSDLSIVHSQFTDRVD